jgi:hypothetical protein
LGIIGQDQPALTAGKRFIGLEAEGPQIAPGAGFFII